MHRFWEERLRVNGKRADAFIQDRVVSATLIKRMDGAASLELACADGDEAILKSGLLDRPGKPGKRAAKLSQFDSASWARFAESRLMLDDSYYRLAGVSGDYSGEGSAITLTFEDEVASLMRRIKQPLKQERHQNQPVGDRAAFINQMRIAVQLKTGVPIGFRSPAEARPRDPKKPEVTDLKKGLDKKDKITIKGVRADEEQLRHLTTALNVADDLKVPDLAVIAMLCAGIGESTWRNVVNSIGYGGVFQGQVSIPGGANWFANMGPFERTRQQATSFLKGGRGYQGGGAIALARQHTDWEPGRIAITVEGAVSNFGSLQEATHFYQQWHKEAEKILEAWGGVNRVVIKREDFEFRAGGTRGGVEHNYWMDAVALAEPVRWRLWAYRNVLWFVPDDWLFQQAGSFFIDQGRQTPGVQRISFQADVGLPISEIEVDAHTDRWAGAPGAVVKVQDYGPLTGNWLTWEERHDCFTELSTFTLHRPAPQLKEPAPTVKTKVKSERAPEDGTIREKIVAVAKRAHRENSRYYYGNRRPMVGTLFPRDKSARVEIDCSAFVTIVYKEAGADDPNGRGYDGQGNTSTLRANGTRTTDPQPGDQVHYGSGAPGNSSHTGIYIGGGKVIEMGGTPGPLLIDVHYRSDFAGYWTCDLGDGS